MAIAFAQRTTERSNDGISPSIWNEKNVKNIDSTGSELVTVKTKLGDMKMESKHVSILFSNPEVLIKEKKGAFMGNAPGVIGTPVGYVPSYDINMSIDNLDTHPWIERGPDGKPKKYLLAPIFIRGGYKSESVILQYGSQWVGAGNPYAIEGHPHNNGLMYIYSIQSLIWTLAKEQDMSNCMKWLDMIVRLCKSASAYFAINEEAFKIITPLRTTEEAMDMLNRSIAFIFFKDPADTKDVVRIVEKSLKRWRKRNTVLDFLADPITGIIAMLLYVPSLHNMIHNGVDEKKTMHIINDKMISFVRTITDNIDKRGSELNKVMLFNLFELHGETKITNEQSNMLYDFCMDTKNARTMAPLDDWKVIDKVELPITIKTTGFKINGQKNITTTKIESLPSDIEGGVKCTASSNNPTTWSGIGLSNPGLYSFSPVKTVGASSIGKGKTLGQTNTALFRVLYGNKTNDDIMPSKGKKYTGKSSAGMLYSEEDGKYDYRQRDSLDITKPFSLLIKPDGSFEVRDSKQQVWFALTNDEKKVEDAYVLIGYKFLEFDFAYNPVVTELQEHKNEHFKQLKQETPVPENPLQGLTGMALFNKLTELTKLDKSTS